MSVTEKKGRLFDGRWAVLVLIIVLQAAVIRTLVSPDQASAPVSAHHVDTPTLPPSPVGGAPTASATPPVIDDIGQWPSPVTTNTGVPPNATPVVTPDS